MKTARCAVIANPVSAAGKTFKQYPSIIEKLESALGIVCKKTLTRRPMDATRIAREMIDDGYTLIVGIGGDGTMQEIVNGFLEDDRPVNPHCSLGIISSGTGQGFARSLGLPSDIGRQLDVITAGASHPVDLGRVTCNNAASGRTHRYFVNECQGGIGSTVVKSVSINLKRFGGRLAFGLGAVKAFFNSTAQNLSVLLDDSQLMEGPFMGVVVANGAYTGGGMKLAPHAKNDDGMLDVLLIQEQTLAQRLASFPTIYSGRHIDLPKFGYHRARTVSISAVSPLYLEADGELVGESPCKIEIIPGGIRVCLPACRDETKEK